MYKKKKNTGTFLHPNNLATGNDFGPSPSLALDLQQAGLMTPQKPEDNKKKNGQEHQQQKSQPKSILAKNGKAQETSREGSREQHVASAGSSPPPVEEGELERMLPPRPSSLPPTPLSSSQGKPVLNPKQDKRDAVGAAALTASSSLPTSPRTTRPSHLINKEQGSPFVQELGAGIYVQLESLLYLLNAESGVVLLLDPSADFYRATVGTGMSNMQQMVSNESFGKSPLHSPRSGGGGSSTPRRELGGGTPLASPSSGSYGGGGGGYGSAGNVVKSLFRPIASIGKRHPSFQNESMQAGVVATGVAVNAGEHDPILCFPLKSAVNYEENVGVVCIANRIGSANPRFTEADECTTTILARSLGHSLTKFQGHMLLHEKPYDSQRLKALGTQGVIQPNMGEFHPKLASQVSETMGLHEQKVLRGSSAPYFQKKGVSHDRYDTPSFRHVQDIADYALSLELVVEAQRRELHHFQSKEEDAVARLQTAQRELTIATQTAAKLQETNDGFQITVTELRRQLQRQNFESALSRKLAPTEELEQEVRQYLNTVNSKMSSGHGGVPSRSHHVSHPQSHNSGGGGGGGGAAVTAGNSSARPLSSTISHPHPPRSGSARGVGSGGKHGSVADEVFKLIQKELNNQQLLAPDRRGSGQSSRRKSSASNRN